LIKSLSLYMMNQGNDDKCRTKKNNGKLGSGKQYNNDLPYSLKWNGNDQQHQFLIHVDSNVNQGKNLVGGYLAASNKIKDKTTITFQSKVNPTDYEVESQLYKWSSDGNHQLVVGGLCDCFISNLKKEGRGKDVFISLHNYKIVTTSSAHNGAEFFIRKILRHKSANTITTCAELDSERFKIKDRVKQSRKRGGNNYEEEPNAKKRRSDIDTSQITGTSSMSDISNDSKEPAISDEDIAAFVRFLKEEYHILDDQLLKKLAKKFYIEVIEEIANTVIDDEKFN
jgi:hypothetical protein